MPLSPTKFATLLTTAVRTIAARENRTIASVQDELGYALGREGGSSIEYWRKGHIPADLASVEKLVEVLVKRQGINRTECEQLLWSADFPTAKVLVATLFPAAVVTEQARPPAQAPLALSPFVVGLPITTPRQFFGRERELKRIFGLWRHFPLQSVAVIGRKRSGKTSLLHYLQRITGTAPAELRPDQRTDWLPQPTSYQWVFVDFQDARMGSRERLLRHLLTSLNLPSPTPCDLDNFMDIMSQHLQRPSIILMDEIGAGIASPELDESFWWSLRALVSHYTEGKLAFLLASHLPPMQLAQDQGKPSPFFNLFSAVELGPLTEAEARDLLASSPRPFTPSDIEWILAQSGCWPCLLQILSRERLLSLDEAEGGDGWRESGLRQIEPFRYLLA